MKKQKGCVLVDRGKWVVRWRDSVPDGNGGKVRKLRFKILGAVTPEHRRSKERKTGKFRIPAEIQQQADELVKASAESTMSVLMTVEEAARIYFAERKDAMLAGRMKKRSYTTLEDRWNLYLKNRVGSRVLRDFKQSDAYRLWQEIFKEAAKEGRDLSKRTMRHIRFCLSGLFTWAINNGLYSGHNPCQADLPEGLREGGETRTYTPAEVSQNLSLLAPSKKAQAIVALCYGAGLIPSEWAALKWEDMQITEDGAIINLVRSYCDGQLDERRLKTRNRKDYVVIDQLILDYVEAYRQELGGITEGFMFMGKKNGILNYRSFYRYTMQPLLNRCTCGKTRKEHTKNYAHQFKRDESLPVWGGWYGFRRCTGTVVAKGQGGALQINSAASVLRNTPTVALKHYVQHTAQEKRATRVHEELAKLEQRKNSSVVLSGALMSVQ
ncbi:MAG TPA: site-specific integrase [Terriglobales bacterium]|jgi:integrase|nr:site-specific integrase [Terriglobales bacterium]